jgi:chemotaxis protein methyltransferase CheR
MDQEYVQFLKTCMPRLRLRWQGFRKVRKQVIRRIKRRLKELQLQNLSAYRAYLERHADEWLVLDSLCRITISRFYRDAEVFTTLREVGLPALTRLAKARNEHILRCWVAGCASGEEVYSLQMLWHRCLSARFPDMELGLVATDVDPGLLERAGRGRYRCSSLRELPRHWIASEFDVCDQWFVVPEPRRGSIDFIEQDIRTDLPGGWFYLVMCRNLVLTYFAEALQREILWRVASRLLPGGLLVVGKQETLPQNSQAFVAYDDYPGMFRKVADA